MDTEPLNMRQAYFDESRTNPEDPFPVVAGFIADRTLEAIRAAMEWHPDKVWCPGFSHERVCAFPGRIQIVEG
jgi:hypothetical protein